MKSRSLPAILFLLLLPAQLPAKSLRAGLFVGSNSGSLSEDELFYAEEDATKMHTVFSTYGMLDEHLTSLVHEPDRDEITRHIQNLRERVELVRAHNELNVECVFYYSGHAGKDGLHVDGQTYAYRDLYRDIRAAPCDLLIVILDACNSGKFLGVKGITYLDEAFRVKIYDSKKGEVFITSSAESEFSQEQDAYKGSVFTHHLANGLLGAADNNEDGMVTLSEAYNFASRKTIQETFGSVKGFQVPTYKYQVQGKQDTVLTALTGSKKAVTAPEGHDGIMTFMDEDRGIIWGDFEITPQSRSLFIPRGRYLVRLRKPDGKLYLARCQVKPSGQSEWEKFSVIPPSQDPLKGQRVWHHWTLRFTGGAHLSPDRTVVRGAGFGGGLAVLVDNLFIPPLYAGVSLSVFTGSRDEVVLDTTVDYASVLLLMEGIVGFGFRLSRTVEISGELSVGAGYAALDRKTPAGLTQTTGYAFIGGLRGQAIWWLTPDIGLVLPTLQASWLAYRKDSEFQHAADFHAGAGFQLKF